MIGRCLAFVLFICSLAAYATERRCLDANADNVDEYLRQQIEKLGLNPNAQPELILLNEDVQLEFTSAGIEKNIFADGFLKFDAGRYRIVPGLGLTLEAKASSLFYVCLQLNGNSRSNYLRIIHLERNGLFSRRFRTEPVALEMRPLNEGVLLVGGILKVFGLGDPKKNDRPQKNEIESVVNQIFQSVFRAGVEQIDIRPTEFHMTVVSQLFRMAKLTRTTHKIKAKSDWLIGR